MEQCGTVHPHYPRVTCVRWGKCLVDDHVGIMEYKNGYRTFIEWGSARYEEYKWKLKLEEYEARDDPL